MGTNKERPLLTATPIFSPADEKKIEEFIKENTMYDPTCFSGTNYIQLSALKEN